jgi:hypothetical protein
MQNTTYIKENYKLSTIGRLEEAFGYKNEQEMNDDMDLTHTLNFLKEQNLEVQDVLFQVLQSKKNHDNEKFWQSIVDEVKERKIQKVLDGVEKLLREFDNETGEKQSVAVQIITFALIWGSNNGYEGLGMLEEAKEDWKEIVSEMDKM